MPKYWTVNKVFVVFLSLTVEDIFNIVGVDVKVGSGGVLQGVDASWPDKSA